MKQAAIGILFSRDFFSVLLIKRRDVPIWVLPGGGIEDNETPDSACAREVLEETGLTVTCTRKVGTYLPINRLASPTHVYECTSNDTHEVLIPQTESEKVQFWPLNALPDTLFFVHKNWIDQALKKTDMPVVKMLDEMTYLKALTLILQHPILSFRYLLARLGCPINL